MRLPQVARDLLKAREVLDRDGWLKGALGANGGPKCATGAVDSVTAGDPWAACTARGRNARHHLRLVITNGVMDWNDAPSRTKQQVLDAFDAAASLAISEALR